MSNTVEEAVQARDPDGSISESYICHAQFYEANSEAELRDLTKTDKPRVVALCAVAKGPRSAIIKKLKFIPNGGGYKVGRKWDLKELKSIRSVGNLGLITHMGKDYFYIFKTKADKRQFCANLESVYRQCYDYSIPEKIGFDDPMWKGLFQAPQTDQWNQHVLKDSGGRYGERAANLELTRRPSRGPNSHKSPKITTPELGHAFGGQFSMPPKQRYKPNSPLVGGSPGVPPMPSVPPVPRNAVPYPTSPVTAQDPYLQQPSRGSQGSLPQGSAQGGVQRPGSQGPQGPHGAQRAHGPPASRSSHSLPGQGAPPQVPPVPQVPGQRPRGGSKPHIHSQGQVQGHPQQGPPGPQGEGPYNHAESRGSTNSAGRASAGTGLGLQSPKRRSQPHISVPSVPAPPVQPLQPQSHPRAPQQLPQPQPRLQQPPQEAREVSPLSASRTQALAPAASLTQPRRSSEVASQPELDTIQAQPLPEQSPQRSVQSLRKQSDASDASFISARDDYSVKSLNIHEGVPTHSRTPSNLQILNEDSEPDFSMNEEYSQVETMDSQMEAAASRMHERRQSDMDRLKKLHRLSPARSPVRSPRKSKFGHSHTKSSVSVMSNSGPADDEAFKDLNNVLTQLQVSGEEDFNQLEKLITGRIAQLHDTQTANVLSLDKDLAAVDTALQRSEEDLQLLVDQFAHVAVQLATIAPQIASMEGMSEGSQVLEMNKRMLVSELENLVKTVSLPPTVAKVLSNPEFSVGNLPSIEDSLVQLFKAHEFLSADQSPMAIAQQQYQDIHNTTHSFDQKVCAFIEHRLRYLVENNEGGVESRIDSAVLGEMYPFAGMLLFVHQTDAPAFRNTLEVYLSTLKQHYDGAFNPYLITWKRKVEAQAQSPGFTFKVVKRAVEETSQPVALKRGMSVKMGSTHANKYNHKVNLNNAGSSPGVRNLCAEFVELLCTQIAAQQQVLVNLFVLSSQSNHKFDVYIHRNPLKLRREMALNFATEQSPQILEPDTTRKTAQQLHRCLERIFGKVEEQIRVVSELVTKNGVLESVYLIGLLEARLDALGATDQEFTKALLERWRAILVPQWRKFIEDQSRIILETHFNMSKRVGILPVCERFVVYAKSVETSISSLEGAAPKTASLVADSNKQVFRAVTQIFERQTQPSAAIVGNNEDKEGLNLHVTSLENLNAIITGLSATESLMWEDILLTVRTAYRGELEAYIADVEKRPLGELLQFVPSRDGVAPKFKPSAFKKAMSNYDLRKNIEVLRKRVLKHFGDEVADEVLVAKVWGAISAEFAAKIGKIAGVAAQNNASNFMTLSKEEVVEVMRGYN